MIAIDPPASPSASVARTPCAPSSLELDAGDHRPARPERRRQDDPDADPRDRAGARRAARAAARPRPGATPRTAPDPARGSATCRRSPGSTPRFTAFEFVDYVAILKEHTDRRARHDEVRRVLDCVGLADVAGRRIRALSGGMRRRLALAQALLGDRSCWCSTSRPPDWTPSSGCGSASSISELAEDRTVLLSTHQTEDVAALCPRVVVLDDGRVLVDGTPASSPARARPGVDARRRRRGPAGLADRRRAPARSATRPATPRSPRRPWRTATCCCWRTGCR